MASRSAVHTATKLVDEPWFVEGDQVLTRNGVQVATVTDITAVRIERRTSSDPTWGIVFEGDDFSSLQVLDDGAAEGSMVAGILKADPDEDPPPGDGYMLVAVCVIMFTATFGGGTAGEVFRRPWRIPASALTAPAD